MTATATASAPPSAAKGTSATASIRQLLTQLTVALNRRRAYSATHPMVQQSEQALSELLGAMVARGRSVTIGVAREELLVDGTVVEGTGAVARELAERLHKRGVGALEFSAGITLAGVHDVLAWLAQETLPGDAPDKASVAAPSVPGILVGRVAYDRLILGDDADAIRHELSSIWRSLAAAAFEEAWNDDAAERPAGGAGAPPNDTLAVGASAMPAVQPSTRAEQATHAGASAAHGNAGSTPTVGAHADGVRTDGANAEDIRATTAGSRTNGGGAADAGSHPLERTSTGDGGATGDADIADASAAADADDSSDAELLAQPDASPDDIAQAIERRVHHPPYARRVARVLLNVTQQVTNAPPAVRAELAERLCTVLRRIGEGSLASIVRAVGAGREQREFLTAVVNALPVSAVIEWLEVTARATDQELSHHLLRILAKLSKHANESKSTVQAHHDFRAAASHLVAGWELADPNPVEHAGLLDHIAMADTSTAPPSVTLTGAPAADGTGSSAATHSTAQDVPAETARVVQMALEIDIAGADAVDAARAMLAGGFAAVLFGWLETAPGTGAAATLWDAVMAPASLTAALILEPFDAAASRTLLGAAGAESIPALLDALEQANNRTARRMVFDRLVEFGDRLAPFIAPRLDASPPWYFARNLLALLREVTPESTESDAPRLSTFMQFLNHQSEQVRSEALRLLLEDRWTRDAALRRALDDSNPRVVGLAVGAAAAIAAERPVPTSGSTSSRGPLSREVATRLVRILDTAGVDEEYRVRAVRALAGAPGPFVRDWLLEHVSYRTRFLRRLALAAPSPTVLAALQVLAHDYSHDSRVEPVLMLASGQRDSRRDAVSTTLAHAVPPEVNRP